MNIPRRALFGKLNSSLFRAIESATAFAKLRGNPYVELVHWLHQLWQTSGGDLQRIVTHYGLEVSQLEKDLTVALGQLPNGASAINDISHLIDLSVERAWVYASLTMGDAQIRGAWLLAGMLETPELRRALFAVSASFQKIPALQLADELPFIIAQSIERKESALYPVGSSSGIPGEASNAFAPAQNAQSALSKYCSDLTALADQGRIDPVVGREYEIRTMVDILLRRRQNNPLLTGEAGVGKTAVVEGLALAISSKAVPPGLQDVSLLSLDVGALLAGASMRGEFEARLKAVLHEAAQSTRRIVLFVDEVHTLVGAGGQAGTGDAANLLKPALARGDLRTIGATTWTEYKKHIEKDPALSRRFQVLQVQEPSQASAVAMVRGLVPMFAQHHSVMILDEAVMAAVSLSHRYIPARQLPDKAISLLDTACARVAMSMHTPSAELQALQSELTSLNARRELAEQEIAIGKLRSNTLAQIDSELAGLSGRLECVRKEWEQSHKTAGRILELRRYLGQDDESLASEQQRAELAELEARLQMLQGDTPRVHTEVDAAVVSSIVADWTGTRMDRPA